VILDRYRIVEQIAAGGLSRVYRGEDQRLPREVCIKVFHSLARNSEADAKLLQVSYEFFVQEAFALSRLRHPNTLRIFDFGHIDDPETGVFRIPVQVSEFMNAGTLSEFVRERTLDLAEALEIVEGLSGALGEAHGEGIIHRDLKPRNILFGTVGQRRVVKLADFGIAKSMYQSKDPRFHIGDNVSRDSHLMYSLNWGAPEQLAGQPVVPATDLYSLGLLVIYMLTGQPLFRAANVKEALGQRVSSARRISELLGPRHLPQAVVDLLKRSCHPQIRKRPADVETFYAELTEASEGSEVWRGPEALSFDDPPELFALEGTPTDLFDDSARPQRIRIGDPLEVEGRSAAFTPLADQGSQEMQVGQGARVEVMLLPDGRGGFCIQIRGLNCFVRLADRPPTSTVQVRQSAPLSLMAPNSQIMAEGSVQLGEAAAGHRIFHVGSRPVAVDNENCRWIAAMDFGPPDDCWFIYRPGVVREA
jgi:serine/threonine-protein kinase